MAKLVYIEFPSPLIKASCFNAETKEEVEVTTIPRGVCKDISCIPEKKGRYKLELEFEYDPSVLNSLSSINISGSQQTSTLGGTEHSTHPTTQAAVNLLNIPGLMAVKPNDDGTISFEIKSEDGSTTEVNADIPGMTAVKNEDATFSVLIPSPRSSRRTTTQEMPTYTKTTTTTTTSSVPASNTEQVVGSFAVPRQQNIKVKLPCPKEHQNNVRTECSGPDGANIPVKCNPVDENTVNLEFSPSSGNGVYSLNFYIANKIFPGCPIQMEVKGI